MFLSWFLTKKSVVKYIFIIEYLKRVILLNYLRRSKQRLNLNEKNEKSETIIFERKGQFWNQTDIFKRSQIKNKHKQYI